MCNEEPMPEPIKVDESVGLRMNYSIDEHHPSPPGTKRRTLFSLARGICSHVLVIGNLSYTKGTWLPLPGGEGGATSPGQWDQNPFSDDVLFVALQDMRINNQHMIALLSFG
uniref:Uncharacterized protein n=1 Tax=Physcomitrium patens TaxID=3218 RepID=A9RX78_PHYPA|nr:hypothetical protein PHYPA_023282 [Physcomitrium patens]